MSQLLVEFGKEGGVVATFLMIEGLLLALGGAEEREWKVT